MGTWQEDQDRIFGGPDVPEIRNRGFGQPAPAAQPDQSTRPRRQPTLFLGDVMDFNPIQGAQAHHAAQGNMLQGMAGDAMAAIANENQSRVAQQREMRRMQHEKELEQMRINALIGRLGQSTPGFWK